MPLITPFGAHRGTELLGYLELTPREVNHCLGSVAFFAAFRTNPNPIPPNTYRLVKDYFEFASKGNIRVKGKDVPVEVYQLLSIGEVETRLAASAGRGLTRFVGRTREVETLKEAFEKTRSGQGQVVGIVGEAGVGKSRLLLELRHQLPRGKYNYLEGQCLHYGSAMPYVPMLDIFRSYVGIKEGDPEPLIKKKMRERILGLDENLTTVLPPFQELLSLRVEDPEYVKLDPKQKREMTFEARIHPCLGE